MPVQNSLVMRYLAHHMDRQGDCRLLGFLARLAWQAGDGRLGRPVCQPSPAPFTQPSPSPINRSSPRPCAQAQRKRSWPITKNIYTSVDPNTYTFVHTKTTRSKAPTQQSKTGQHVWSPFLSQLHDHFVRISATISIIRFTWRF